MKPGRSGWAGAIAHRMGLSGEVDFTPCRVGITLHVPCHKGLHVVDVEVPARLHPEGVAKRMLNQGWTFGSKLSCPEHSRREKASAPKEPKKKETPAMATAAANDSAPAPSEAARKAKRLIYQALEDYYDDARKAYRPGHSDENIAKETGASVEFVKQIREIDFGPLGEPSELVDLRRDFDAMRQHTLAALADLERRQATFTQRLAAICKANGWALPL